MFNPFLTAYSGIQVDCCDTRYGKIHLSDLFIHITLMCDHFVLFMSLQIFWGVYNRSSAVDLVM